MSGTWNDSLREQLRNKEFRDAYVAEDIRTGITFQIRALREARGLSQSDLGSRIGNPQSAIARVENPNYGRFSLTTLLKLASAFDVALLVRFVAFSELVERNRDLSPGHLAVPAFTEDVGLRDYGTSASGSSTITTKTISPPSHQPNRPRSMASAREYSDMPQTGDYGLSCS
jgi:transcriptional regulator with XRE-family HTH domain